MKRRQPKSDAEKRYGRKLRLRKLRLCAVLLLSSVLVLLLSIRLLDNSNSARLEPQIDRAVVQVAKLLPQLEQNEEALRGAYRQMTESWEELLSHDAFSDADFALPDETELEEIVGDTLSWMNRVTKLKVGRDGFMFVVDKETSRILAHPDENYVGRLFQPFEQLEEDEVIAISSIRRWTKPESLELKLGMMEPYKLAASRVHTFDDFIDYMRMSLIGCVMDYGDAYIVCGVPVLEWASYIVVNALAFTLIFVILMWLLIKWISLVTELRRESVRELRLKLICYAALSCAVMFGACWYILVLADVTNDLQTMDKHADAAVETLSTYREQREKLNGFLDEYYETQCWLAGQIVTKTGRDKLTRHDMQHYADDLKVKYIYVFDQRGRVVVTNSPYDHYSLSDDPADPSYEFRALLDGVFGVVQDPALDDRFSENVQYIGVSLRSEEDLCDGFVMIAVDPALRDDLISPLTVDTVLSNMIIGLPEHAIAVDKATLDIIATTGIGFKDESVEELGIRKENLTEDFSGFLKINGQTYYAGVSETEELYLVPIVRRTATLDNLLVSLRLTLCTAVTALIILLLTLCGYQRVVLDGAPAEEEEKAPEAEGETSGRGLFSGLSDLFSVQNKWGLEERWGMESIPGSKQTPEQRIRRIVYRLLLVFCLGVLLPTLYASLDQSGSVMELGNLAYVMSGNWQKGFNIFALTACVFLLRAMYVSVVLLNRLLYLIARVSDMRVETVCLLLKNALKYICVVIFVYYGLAQFGVDTRTLLASAGILSLMISFGAKDLVSDIIAGFFTLVEGSYKVGDFITAGSWYGTVTEIGLRTTKVSFFADTKIFNNSSLRDIVNSDGKVARMVLEAPTSYNADLTEVEAILAEELPKMTDRIPGLVKPPQYEGVESFGDSAVNLRIAIYVEPGVRYPALRALNREVKLMFDRRGIEIPYSQIVVHHAQESGENREPPII